MATIQPISILVIQYDSMAFAQRLDSHNMFLDPHMSNGEDPKCKGLELIFIHRFTIINHILTIY